MPRSFYKDFEILESPDGREKFRRPTFMVEFDSSAMMPTMAVK